MAFDVILQINASENNSMNKMLTNVLTASGVLKESTSITDPEILIEADYSVVAQCNYLTIPIFGRSYFITAGMSLVRNGLISIPCHVDVLYSFREEIRSNYGIVRKQEKNNAYNLYINDSSLVAYQDPYILTEPFPSGFTARNFILAIAGA